MSIFTIQVGVPAPQEPPDNGAASIVTSGFGTAQAYAATSFGTARDLIQQLGQSGQSLNSIRFTIPEVNPGDFSSSLSLPQPPASNVSYNAPVQPYDPGLTPVDELAIGPAPEFTAQPLPLNIPVTPGALTASVPLAPSISDAATPNAPTIVLPDAPSMLGITIPLAPALNIPDFSATLAAAPAAPANTFAFAETAYTDTLLQSLQNNLNIWVNGAHTGLDPVVEAAIWERGRARENLALGRKMLDAYRNFASRGFSKPPGVLSIELERAGQDTVNTLSDQSRDVMIKQADLEQTNRRFAFETATKVESELLTYNNLIAQRAFDAAKFVQQVALDIFNGQVQEYNAQVQAYNTEAQVYKTRIEAELTKLESYKAQLEGQRIIGELNLQNVEIYKARITAALSQIEIFKAQVEAANLVLNNNKVRIESFAAQINAYDAQVRAKAAEYNGYATAVQAEVAKIEVFKGQAQAYSSVVQGYSTAVSAAVAKSNQQIEIRQRLPIDMFKARTEVFRAQVDGESARVTAGTRTFEAQVQSYTATANAQIGQLNTAVQAYKAKLDAQIGSAGVQAQVAKANVDAAVSGTQVLVEAIKGGAQTSAQLAAAALSAVNLSSQISNSVSNTASNTSSNIANNTAASQVGDVTYHNLSTE
jgi:hypothetical protein